MARARDGRTRRWTTTAVTLLVGLAALRRAVSVSARRPDFHGRSRNAARERERGRGREADGPGDIPAPGWKDVLWRTYEQVTQDRILLIAAGVTFYGLLALFPALAAFVSIYGLFADPQSVVGHVQTMAGVLPDGAIEIIGGQMEQLAQQRPDQLGIGFAVGLAVALWSANNGMKAIFEATNVAYGERENRSFIRLTLVTFVFTMGALVLLMLAIATIVVVPIVLDYLGLGQALETIIRIARWPVLLLVVIGAVSLIYRYGPSRERAQWRWISPGSVTASVLWIILSIGFSWYVANFGTYNETYGSLGAAIGFMVWMWLSATVVIMGAELDAEMEHQTKRDSTTGPPEPMGARGAHVADTVGESTETDR